MKKKTSSQSLYVIFGVVIALLIALIGYFVYLLVSPSDTTTSSNTTVTNTTTTNKNKNKTKKTNTNGDENANANTNTVTVPEDDTNTTATTEDSEGLVEPKPEEEEEEEEEEEVENDEVIAGEGEQVVTLYFPKTASACGEVFAVQRAITPEEDLYGQILLATMAGPSDDETGYTSAMPSGLRLRRVEYSATGPVIYVNESWSDADDCDQQTAEAQLVETANAMFDFPAGTDGEVIVGYPEDTETDTEEETEEDTAEEETE